MAACADRSKWKTRLRKAIVILLMGISFGSLGFCILLDRQFALTRPHQPQPESGRVYARIIHGGTTAYLTRIETLPYDYGLEVMTLFAIAAAILNQRWRCFGPFTK